MLAYRSDIDGLRAIAVLSVILYHAHVPGLPGGYVGVDVFFVISGFLIASIILKDLEHDRFSVAKFYERRIRRIFPALFAVLAASALGAYYLLLPRQLAAFADSAVSTTLFYANVLFWSEAGYFARASESKPLLHTWSLCVEEQFYFVFPLLVALVHRFRRAQLANVMGLLALVSFAVSQWLLTRDAEAAFFLPHSRAWELLVGALLTQLPSVTSERWRNGLSLAGLIAITIAVTCFSTNTRFPGAAALVPVLGSAAIIHAGSSGTSLVGRMIGSKVAVAIGLISYGLYLWHWPLLVFARTWFVAGLTPLITACVLLATFALSVASYYWLETPIRRGRIAATQLRVFSYAALAIAVVAGTGVWVSRQDGLPSRLPTRALAFEAQDRGTSRSILKEYCRAPAPEEGFRTTECVIGKLGSPASFMVWGDSHAASLVPAIVAASDKLGRAGLVATRPACPPLLDVRTRGNACQAFHRAARKLVTSSAIRDVILVGRWATCVEGVRYKQELGGGRILSDQEQKHGTPATNPEVFQRGLARTLETLQTLGKRVIVVADVPEVGYSTADVLARLAWWGRSFDIRPTRSEYFTRQARVFEILRRLRADHSFDVVYPHHGLCAGSHCEVQVGDEVLYKDTNHLSPSGSLRLAPLFERALSSR